jgi:hypothetical protein
MIGDILFEKAPKDVSDHSAASVPPSGCWPQGISMAYHETLVQNGGGKGVGVCKL